MLDDDREDIAIDEIMGDPDPLSAVLDGIAPDPGVAEPAHEVTVELGTDILDRTPGPYDERDIHVGFFVLGF